ncbi:MULTISPECIES: hypothetical protein [unclassified Achromobacter]|uniref:hypothetical protein n=1 Tax=unclassified Achromobacter TaxID=2626865 RepID=UPI000B51D77C|nr:MULTISPECIES: hypothetical protein [unclassified Achromobacter]OWT75702.1 hypothetical protein CEY04_19335 [Achromobacter sp. HZ28]OWT76363.1 hypothetical protein CEY05_14785 [Achromobacter sp. HZ34]
MSSTLSFSQATPTAVATPAPIGTPASATSDAPTFTNLCNLRDPAQFHSITVHGFPGEKSAQEMDAMVNAVSTGLEQQCGIPAARIVRVTHGRPADLPRRLGDKVLVDLRLVSSPETPRVTLFHVRKIGPDQAGKDLA